MARKNLFERLDKLGVDVRTEYKALIRLLKIERCIGYSYSYHTLIEYINEHYFRSLPAAFRSPYLSVEEMMTALKLRDESTNLDDLFLLSELLIAIMPDAYIEQNESVQRQINTIESNIIAFLEKLNHKLYEIDNNRYIIIAKNHAAIQAVGAVNDDSTAIALIEYNHYSIKGDLECKRNILTTLGSYIEPILKSRVLQSAGYKQLESDVGFLLNCFHVRHNNKIGPKAQEYIVALTDKQLEKWYDDLYNAILSVIIINDHIPVQTELASLKTSYKWKT